MQPYFPLGKITIVQGDPGIGKTSFSCGLAALVSTGGDICGHRVEYPGSVLMISVEDDASTLRGRIEASGGNIEKCFILDNASGLTFNAPEIEQAIKETGARLVVFDPLQAFMGGKVDMFRANETRPILAELSEMAKRNACAVVIVSHMSKGLQGTKAIYRALGSIDIVAASRSALYIGLNPNDEKECVMVQIKSSNARKGASIAYTIGERGGITWKGYSPLTVDDIEAARKREESGLDYDHEPLVQLFRHLITERPGGGFWPYPDLQSAGQKLLGFPPFTDAHSLKRKLEGSFSRELQQRDKLIITCGVKQNGQRGIRIEQYTIPKDYQMQIHSRDVSL